MLCISHCTFLLIRRLAQQYLGSRELGIKRSLIMVSFFLLKLKSLEGNCLAKGSIFTDHLESSFSYKYSGWPCDEFRTYHQVSFDFTITHWTTTPILQPLVAQGVVFKSLRAQTDQLFPFLSLSFPKLPISQLDPVPTLPPRLGNLGFVHPSNEKHIVTSGTSDGDWYACDGQDNTSDKCSAGAVPNLFAGDGSDHDGPYGTVYMGGCHGPDKLP